MTTEVASFAGPRWTAWVTHYGAGYAVRVRSEFTGRVRTVATFSDVRAALVAAHEYATAV